MEITRIGSFALAWGESLVWDEQRTRLLFVDCMGSSIHWLEDGSDRLHTFVTPSMPTGLVPTDDGRLVAVLDDGLHLVDVDAGTSSLLAAYPEALGKRANDACADLDGNIITGTLNVRPAPGSAWRFSATDGWALLDDDVANTNGPNAAVLEGASTLVIGDTSAVYWSYAYDRATGTVGPRSVFGDTTDLAGMPDGATFDADGGFWAALVGGGQLACFTPAGLDRTLAVPTLNPTDVTFGGPDLDRLFVVSIGGDGDLDGALLAIDGLGVVGRPEPRFAVRG